MTTNAATGAAMRRRHLENVMNLFLLFTILLSGSVSFTGCRQPAAVEQQQTAAPKPAEYRKLSAQDARVQLDADKTIKLIDVRTEGEHDEKRIANSILIPDYDIEKLAPTMLPNKNEKLFLYCRSGRRSRAATLTLLEMGYTNVYDIGGLNDWPFETISGK